MSTKHRQLRAFLRNKPLLVTGSIQQFLFLPGDKETFLDCRTLIMRNQSKFSLIISFFSFLMIGQFIFRQPIWSNPCFDILLLHAPPFSTFILNDIEVLSFRRRYTFSWRQSGDKIGTGDTIFAWLIVRHYIIVIPVISSC